MLPRLASVYLADDDLAALADDDLEFLILSLLSDC